MVDKGSFSILRTAFSGSRYLLKKRPFYITNQDMQHAKEQMMHTKNRTVWTR
jgi:hypothetical protein